MTTKKVIIPDGYKDVIYRATYYLLGKIAHFVPRSIHPNQITIVAFLCALIGTALLYFIKTPVAYLYWTLFNFIWYILDALDGIHARLTEQTSEYGAFLDHALDNIYFIFMFAIFAAKFDLLHVFYIYVICLRITAALMVFVVQYHTKKYYLGSFTGGGEFLLFSLAMIFSYFFPHFNVAAYTTNVFLLNIIHFFNLQTGIFMKLTFFIYAVGVPFAMVSMFQFAKRELDPKLSIDRSEPASS